jgi:hypothetical protein
MSLTIGARLGPYEIVSPIGAGGMGEHPRVMEKRSGLSARGGVARDGR